MRHASRLQPARRRRIALRGGEAVAPGEEVVVVEPERARHEARDVDLDGEIDRRLGLGFALGDHLRADAVAGQHGDQVALVHKRAFLDWDIDHAAGGLDVLGHEGSRRLAVLALDRLQDAVADAMTVEAVPRVDDQGRVFDDQTRKLMHTTMQTLGRIAIIGGSALVAGVGGYGSAPTSGSTVRPPIGVGSSLTP